MRLRRSGDPAGACFLSRLNDLFRACSAPVQALTPPAPSPNNWARGSREGKGQALTPPPPLPTTGRGGADTRADFAFLSWPFGEVPVGHNDIGISEREQTGGPCAVALVPGRPVPDLLTPCSASCSPAGSRGTRGAAAPSMGGLPGLQTRGVGWKYGTRADGRSVGDPEAAQRHSRQHTRANSWIGQQETSW
jgi:hypothetical protein